MSTIVMDKVTYTDKLEHSIKDFSYNFLANKIYAIVGKETSGVDVLFDCLSSKMTPQDGKVFFDGKKISYKRNKDICYLKKVVKFFSINTLMKQMKRRYKNFDTFFAYDLLRKCKVNVSLPFRRQSLPNQDIILCILTIASNASVQILSNPVEKADLKVRKDIYEAIYKHHHKIPSTIIIYTNIIDEVQSFINEILLLDNGILIEDLPIEKAKTSFTEISGRAEVVKSLITGMKVIGYEDRGNEFNVCIYQKLTKDLMRKFQKYQVKINDVSIQKVLVYLLMVKEKKEYFN